MSDHDHATARMRLGDIVDGGAHAIDDAGGELLEIELAFIAELHRHLDQSFIEAHIIRDGTGGIVSTSLWNGVYRLLSEHTNDRLEELSILLSLKASAH